MLKTVIATVVAFYSAFDFLKL